jgi:hypothetical protein
LSLLDKAIEKLSGAKEPAAVKVPDRTAKRILRGRERMRKGAPLRNLCWRFYRGQQFAFIDSKNVLQIQPTVTNVGGGGMKPHRVRQAST